MTLCLGIPDKHHLQKKPLFCKEGTIYPSISLKKNVIIADTTCYNKSNNQMFPLNGFSSSPPHLLLSTLIRQG